MVSRDKALVVLLITLLSTATTHAEGIRVDNSNELGLICEGNFLADRKIIGKHIENPIKVEKKEVSLSKQIDGLFEQVAIDLDIPVEYVRATYLIAGGTAIYDTKYPDIYNDLTTHSIKGAFDIEGASSRYDKEYSRYKLNNKAIDRQVNRKYYLPDAVYNVMSDIVEIMNIRRQVDRGELGIYFDNLLPDVRDNIIYYEAIMQYAGFSEQSVNRIYKAYEKMVYMKDENEYVIDVINNTEYRIKDKFRGIFNELEIGRNELIAKAMSFDGLLASASSKDDIEMQLLSPHKIGYTSRENMMRAAISLVGKVRYIWGGGHGGSSNINGISPIWLSFNELYEQAGKDNKSIQNSNTWCPIHGDCGYACSLGDTGIRTIDDYIDLRGEVIKNTPSYRYFKTANLSKIYTNRNLANTDGRGNGISIAAHRVEGLDCSGYISWIYNQIDKTRVYDSNARGFVGSGRLRELDFGDKLYAGDVIAWSSHICMIVGDIDNEGKVYVQVEQTPSKVRFGVAYYSGASESKIEKAKDIAREANALIGGYDGIISTYNINKLAGLSRVNTDEDGNVYFEYTGSLKLGRLNREYIDEDDKVGGYNRSMKELTASEIIQHTIDNLPKEYLKGIGSYDGKQFSVKR